MNDSRPVFAPVVRLFVVTAVVALFAQPAAAADDKVDFAREVLPILSDNCFHCHGPDEKARKAKLRLDTKDGAFRVADGVAVVSPGKPEASELVKRITSGDPDERMPPPDGIRKLTPKQVDTLKRWVAQGAPWGLHWAFAPTLRPPVPAVTDKAWAKNDIDAFVLARLQKEALSPSPEADRQRLIRRVSFDLTGLPPTPVEVDAFVADVAPDAYEKVVDRLLASPRYGERMASDWLDVARFADTHGYQMDRFRPMHAYRDWVIKAFNQNLPFDQFATWQLAGDLLPNATKDQRLATAFNRLHMQNEEGGIVAEEFRVAYVTDRVNTAGTAFLGMTFECARCHDHKYDPITQRDVYSLFAFFQNIDESGQTSYFTDAMPVPTMLLSTDEQDAKLATLEAEIKEKERLLAVAVRAVRLDEVMAFTAKAEAEPRDSLPGCVAQYRFDRARGVDVPNYRDKATPAKLVDKVEFVDAPWGKVARLTGDNGFTLPGVRSFARVDPFSMVVRVKPGDLAERAVLVHQSKAPIDAGSRGVELLLEGGRVAFGLHHMWPGNSLKVRTTSPIAVDHWTTLGVRYDGSSRAGGVGIFVNGVEAELEVVRDGLWKDITYGGTEPPLAIGHRFRDNGFHGDLDEMWVFDRELAESEMENLAQPDSGRKIEGFRPARPATVLPPIGDGYARAFSPAVRAAREALRTARKAQSDYVNPIPEAMVMKEMPKPKPAYVLKRGNYDQPGERVTADTPKFLPRMSRDLPRNRLGLARWMFDPANPLTARVTVNRLWQQMFGRGLVESTDNFGSTGAVPSHPELLDFLARAFADDMKWDQRRFLKFLAMSATYRQSSKAGSELLARDPQNELLARGPARKLTAEMLRDQALAASGLLVERVGGPSVKPYQPPGLWEIAMGRPTYDQGHGADLYRRSLYTFVKRTVAPPSLLTFDAGDRSACTVRRQSTSTPLQGLALLNDVQLVEAARKVAERVMTEGGADDASRVGYAFRLVTGRSATPREAGVLRALLAEQRMALSADPAAARRLLAVGESKPDPKLDPVEVAAACALAQALFSHDEAVMRR